MYGRGYVTLNVMFFGLSADKVGFEMSFVAWFNFFRGFMFLMDCFLRPKMVLQAIVWGTG